MEPNKLPTFEIQVDFWGKLYPARYRYDNKTKVKVYVDKDTISKLSESDEYGMPIRKLIKRLKAFKKAAKRQVDGERNAKRQ